MKQLVFVFIGGGAGSIARFLISKFLNTPDNTIPFGTLIVNTIGSLLIGIILGVALKYQSFSQNMVLLLTTGFCGGFTTFSAFAFENYDLLKSGDLTAFFVYTLASIIIGFTFVFAGVWLVKFL